LIEIFLTPRETAAIKVTGATGIVAGLCYLAWRLHRTSSAIESLAHSLVELVKLRADELKAKKVSEAISDEAFLDRRARAVVLEVIEIFPANTHSKSWGVALFRVRNMGADSIFTLGIARHSGAGTPPDAGQPPRILVGGEARELELLLDPALGALDEATVAVWYRDLFGRNWRRGLHDQRAALIEAPAAEAANQIPAAGADAPV
jgi:hypothetical protein